MAVVLNTLEIQSRCGAFQVWWELRTDKINKTFLREWEKNGECVDIHCKDKSTTYRVFNCGKLRYNNTGICEWGKSDGQRLQEDQDPHI